MIDAHSLAKILNSQGVFWQIVELVVDSPEGSSVLQRNWAVTIVLREGLGAQRKELGFSISCAPVARRTRVECMI